MNRVGLVVILVVGATGLILVVGPMFPMFCEFGFPCVVCTTHQIRICELNGTVISSCSSYPEAECNSIRDGSFLLGFIFIFAAMFIGLVYADFGQVNRMESNKTQRAKRTVNLSFLKQLIADKKLRSHALKPSEFYPVRAFEIPFLTRLRVDICGSIEVGVDVVHFPRPTVILLKHSRDGFFYAAPEGAMLSRTKDDLYYTTPEGETSRTDWTDSKVGDS